MVIRQGEDVNIPPYTYNLTDIRTMAGLEAVRETVSSQTNIQPVDGLVVFGVLAGKKEHPHAEITYPEPIPLEVLELGEAKGSRVISRLAELSLR